MNAAGVNILGDRKIVRVVGEDRVSFFHGMCSADIKGVEPGQILPALILTEHAHVIADVYVWVARDALILDVEREAWAQARAHLERLLVADDVEFEERDEVSVIDIEGPKAFDGVVRGLDSSIARPGEYKFVVAGDLLIGSLPRSGGPAMTIVGPTTKAEGISSKVLGAVPGSRRIGAAALDTIRVEHGIARIGIDTTDKTIA